VSSIAGAYGGPVLRQNTKQKNLHPGKAFAGEVKLSLQKFFASFFQKRSASCA
jgi:hypothetical protein